MAYGTKYRIEFASISNEQYRIDLMFDNYTGSITSLTGGANPFVVEYNESVTLYEPTRFQSATISFLSKNYLLDLFAEYYQDIKVNAFKNNNLIYTGFLIPNIYNQANNGYATIVELESVSALATLDNIPYGDTKKVMTFNALIREAIAASKGDYRYVYIPPVWNNTNTIKSFSVSYANFIDEEGEKMTYKEILEEICKFYNFTITEKNADIYFIDADYISKGRTQYYRYNSVMSGETVVNLSSSIQLISDANSTGFDNNLSKIETYSKVTVKCSNYEIDKDRLFPELDNSLLTPLSPISDIVTDNGWTYIKNYYNNESNYKQFQYNKTGTYFTEVPFSAVPTAYKNRAGCNLISYCEYENENRPNKLEFVDMFQIKLFENSDYSLLLDTNTTDNSYKLLMTTHEMPYTVIDNDIYFSINFDIRFYDKNDGFPKHEKSNRDDTGKTSGFYVPIQIRCGEYYFRYTTAPAGVWTKDTTNYINCQVDINKDNHYTWDWLQCKDTNDFLYNVPDLSGCIFKGTAPVFGDLEFSIFPPRQTTNTAYDHRWIFIKNFEVNCQKAQKARTEKQDTLYTNIIGNYVNEFEDIELKLTSKNNSELALSSVINADTLLLVDTVNSYYSNNAMKPEHLIINKICDQYQRSKIKLNEDVTPEYTPYQVVKLNSMPDNRFLITGESIDYRNNKSNLTLLELN
ncbi:hypothetical protein LJC54_00145 [Parabacteroides sp. OttesenSCG-928-J18]|nr:hypothetical protein [Parabacteroides sp. OttesenSCG-928-J18]